MALEASHLRVWFAAPAAAAAFDVAALAGGDRETWNSLHSDRRRRDWAVSRVLLGSVVAPDSACRSFSHSHAHAALAFGPDGGCVGVDLEWMATRDFRGMAEIGFSPAEAAYIAGIGEPAQQRAVFYELWTLKEACTKALGLSLVDGLRLCRFVNEDFDWCATIPTGRSWHAIVFAPRTDLRLALVSVFDTVTASTPAIVASEWPDPRPVAWPVRHRFHSRADGRSIAC